MKHAFPAGPRKTDRVCRPSAPEVATIATTRRDQLVAAHLKLVESIARGVIQRLPPSFELDDLIGAGYVGLIVAADNYAPEKHGSIPFRIYARKPIRGAILESVRRRHYTEATRPPLEDVPASRLASRPAVDRQIDAARDRLRILEALTWLSCEQRAVIVARYSADEPSAKETARALGTTAARVAQLHEDAIARLRTRLRA